MAQFNGSGPASNGLVYLLDNGNQRSYAGPPIQNLAQTIVPVSTSGPNIEYVTGSVSTMIPNLGQTVSSFVNGYNSNPSSYCCMQQFFFTNGNSNVPCSGSTTYTYAIVYKNTSGYTHPNYMYRYEFTSGGSYVTEAGVFDSAKQISLGDGWFWAWNTFTTQATTAQIVFRSFYYQYNVSDIFYMARVMVTPGDYTQLNPNFWPALNTTRSSTQVFSDPLGTNTFTASNLTYASNGTLGFNGSNGIITSPNNTALDTQTPTVEVWVKTNATTQNGAWFEKGGINTQYSLFQEGGVIQWRMNIGGVTNLSTTTASFMNTSDWYQVVGTYTSGSRILYINGVQVNSDTQTGTIATNASGMSTGALGGNSGGYGYYFNGNIGVVRIYNRALSANEVMQNFNATRGRYGI
jgi:hypothetical protein